MTITRPPAQSPTVDTSGATKPDESAPPPKPIDPLTPYYFDAVRILGTGNSTGLFGALVAYYYFGKGGWLVLLFIKFTAGIYLVGVCLFTWAFHSLIRFSILQLEPPPEFPDPLCPYDPKKVKLKVERWRKSAIRATKGSFVLWWLGTGLAVGVLILLPLTP
jgi:hypothetical protein